MKELSFILVGLLFSWVSFAQERTLSGQLFDDEGLPLPGVTITVKGTTVETQTDFDGKYSISCEVGDVLVFGYVGLITQEVAVTDEMFPTTGDPLSLKKVAVEPVISRAYQDSLVNHGKEGFTVPDFSKTAYTFKSNRGYFDYHHIKDVVIGDSVVKVKSYADDAFFELEINQRTGVQYVPNGNLPKVQATFAQGRPLDGALQWRGPETGEIFSYGPRLANLVYDGSSYPFDNNGKLVPVGFGNGSTARAYDNSIFATGINSTTALAFYAKYGQRTLNIKYQHNSLKDLFDQAGNLGNTFRVNYVNNNSALKWKAHFNYSISETENANINALHNQVYFGSLITPPSFSNNQGFLLPSGGQRSFSPDAYDNPLGLLKRNRNKFDSNQFTAALSGNLSLGQLNLAVNASFTKDIQEQFVDLSFRPKGFQSTKTFDQDDFVTQLSAKMDQVEISYDFYMEPFLKMDYSYNHLDFAFSGQLSNQPDQSLVVSPSKSTLQLNKGIAFRGYFGFNMNLTLRNKTFYSSVQGDRWWLPAAQLNIEFGDLLYSDFLYVLDLNLGYSKDVVDFPLYYSNYSYNSLNLVPQDSQQYATNNDLFINSSLNFEEVEQFDVSVETRFWRFLELTVGYFYSKNGNSIYPVFQSDAWQLVNAADVSNQGVEINLELSTIKKDFKKPFDYSTALNFSTRRPEVQRLHINGERLPIAGFETISKNLIVGQPAGVLVGSVYQRDSYGRRIIGSDGFPLVDPEPQILGNPVSDFNLGWSNTIEYGPVSLNFLLDWKSGGDVWNGTQNVLSYFGVSQESALLRGTTNFIFDGVNAQGNQNTVPVDFAPASGNVADNRWVRYGYAGVAEDAIVDGSFLNLNSVSLSYQLVDDDEKFFREIELSIFGNNLWNTAKFDGANPYTGLFGNASAKGLNYFNMPLTTEVGLLINIKI